MELSQKSAAPRSLSVRQPRRASLPTTQSPDLAPDSDERVGAVAPRRLEETEVDSVAELNHFLEEHSRRWSTTIRVMEQQRQQVRRIEADREEFYAKLVEAMHAVIQAARATERATAQEGVSLPELESIFETNRVALEELEAITVALKTNFVCWRPAWLQFSQTSQAAETLRSETLNKTSMLPV